MHASLHVKLVHHFRKFLITKPGWQLRSNVNSNMDKNASLEKTSI